jgi:archaellum component FlaG (FlaF/FlaG flagellin family)
MKPYRFVAFLAAVCITAFVATVLTDDNLGAPQDGAIVTATLAP